jgi:hypothetical protein
MFSGVPATSLQSNRLCMDLQYTLPVILIEEDENYGGFRTIA